jgi:hypothetical protein
VPEDFVSDVSSLDINPPDQDYWGEYKDAATRTPTPLKGLYLVRMPEQFKYTRAQSGGLKVDLSGLTIVGGDHDGYEMNYIGVSTTKFKNANASSAADVLRNFFSVIVTGADGKPELQYNGPQPRTKEEWADAFASIAGQVTPFPVYLHRRGWDKVERKEYADKDFPEGQDFVEIGANGETRRVWANLEPTVRGFAPRAPQK